jgi:hypothetical protein
LWAHEERTFVCCPANTHCPFSFPKGHLTSTMQFGHNLSHLWLCESHVGAVRGYAFLATGFALGLGIRNKTYKKGPQIGYCSDFSFPLILNEGLYGPSISPE